MPALVSFIGLSRPGLSAGAGKTVEKTLLPDIGQQGHFFDSYSGISIVLSKVFVLTEFLTSRAWCGLPMR